MHFEAKTNQPVYILSWLWGFRIGVAWNLMSVYSASWILYKGNFSHNNGGYNGKPIDFSRFKAFGVTATPRRA
jgi:hypothetical protein